MLMSYIKGIVCSEREGINSSFFSHIGVSFQEALGSHQEGDVDLIGTNEWKGATLKGGKIGESMIYINRSIWLKQCLSQGSLC